MKKTTILLLTLVPLLAWSKLSEEATVSLLTCGPGTDLYAAFGHSAVRVNDPVLGIDQVYNYGTFDFDTPNFYLKFIRGQMDYKLSRGNFKRFVRSYEHYGRSVVEQEILISPSQKEALNEFLKENYKPANAYYRYDFLLDNCATRIRDAVQVVLGDSLMLPQEQFTEETTYRDLLETYIVKSPWVDFGIDIALGAPTDGVAGPNGAMFLPDHLQTGLEKSELLVNGNPQPLLGPAQEILPEKLPVQSRNILTEPFTLAILFVLLGFLAYLFSSKRVTNIARRIVYAILGITSLQLLFLTLATEHYATATNLNLLWASPLFLILVFLPIHRFAKWLLVALLLPLVLVLASNLLLPQVFHFAVFPLTVGIFFWVLSGWRAKQSLAEPVT